MSGMFENDSKFNQPLGDWNTARVTDLSGMFVCLSGCTFNQPIGAWNTSQVTDMSGMFENDSKFNHPIGRWNTARVTDMSDMFGGASAFDRPIGGWNTARVTDMSDMFGGASAFDQPIGGWNTARVKSMSYMFDAAVRFNQPIGNWNTGRVGNMIGMFGDGSGLAISNYNQLLIGWAAKRQIHHVQFDAGRSTYNGAAVSARRTLQINDGWALSDGGRTQRRGVPQITARPRIAPITFGQKLTSADVVGGTANAPGRFFLTRSPLVLSAGIHRVTVVFRPRLTAYYAAVATTVLVQVNRAPRALRLADLNSIPHGTSVTITVAHVVAGARVAVSWQPTGNPAMSRSITARGTSVRVDLKLPVTGTYAVTATATDPNYLFAGATGSTSMVVYTDTLDAILHGTVFQLPPSFAARFHPYEIPTDSMAPAIQPDDLVLSDRAAYQGTPIARGDIIVFLPTPAAIQTCGAVPGVPLVKRVIGLPGDVVTVAGGVTRVNGTVYRVPGETIPDYSVSFPPVPAGDVLVLGDNRPDSCDSHVWVGNPPNPAVDPFVPQRNVLGRVSAIYFPTSQVARILPGVTVQRVDVSRSPQRPRFDYLIILGRSAQDILGAVVPILDCAQARTCARLRADQALDRSLGLPVETKAQLLQRLRDQLVQAIWTEVIALDTPTRRLAGDCAQPTATWILTRLTRDAVAASANAVTIAHTRRIAVQTKLGITRAIIQTAACWN
jgi:signal peptidase I